MHLTSETSYMGWSDQEAWQRPTARCGPHAPLLCATPVLRLLLHGLRPILVHEAVPPLVDGVDEVVEVPAGGRVRDSGVGPPKKSSSEFKHKSGV